MTVTSFLLLGYLIISALLIPVNLWAAITPHLHSELSMRILHGISTACLLPMLVSLLRQREYSKHLLVMILGIFAVVMLIVNARITVIGMGVAFGWLDHLLLSLASISAILVSLNQRVEPSDLGASK